MNTQNAQQILSKSISNLQSRRGQIHMGDLEAEVINNACLYLLKNYRQDIQKVHDVTAIGTVIGANIYAYEHIAKHFVEAARLLFPNDYSQDLANSAILMILQNISWSGMWDFLRNYFQQNHGIQIDSVQAMPTAFHSSKHKRYQSNVLVSESLEKRIVSVVFIKNKVEATFSIEPSLSPKNAYLLTREGRTAIYKGYDPDYRFTIYFDAYDEIERVLLELPNRSLKIEYLD